MNHKIYNSSRNFLGIWHLTMLIPFLLILSCKKFVEVKAPVTGVNAENVYKSEATASAALLGIYTNLNGVLSGGRGVSITSGLSADELTLWGGSNDTKYQAFYQNALNNSSDLTAWSAYYYYLLQVNSAIEGLNSSSDITASAKKQLLGEAMFMRAFIYFYLVNYYGDVPLIITSDYRINSTIERTAKSQVWQQIIADLKEAQSLLTDKYVGANVLVPSNERTRPNKWAATALLSRAYLYDLAWSNAEVQATSIIDQKTLFDTVPLNGVFLKNSKEAIWQLQPVNSDRNTEDGATLILQNEPSNNQPFYISSFLLSAFEPGDQRKNNWIGTIVSNGTTYYYPYKYKVYQSSSLSEYLMVLRLGEQYLIRAEARAQQNKISEALNDLNLIRKRAGVPDTSITNKDALLACILHERQVELFTELGHRWLDLKRTGNVDAVMNVVTPVKGGTWNSNWALYPIPIDDIQKNPKISQNLGY